MEITDYETGEIITVLKKGLWSHFPIPAYQVLAAQRQWGAQKLLTCLVSFLGKGSMRVFPSYLMISKTSGMSPNTIRKSLNVLEDNGFIKIFNVKQGKKERNIYYLQESCWDTSKMNKMAQASRTPTSKCLDCGVLMDRGGYGTSPKLGKVHWGCGGNVVKLSSIQTFTKKSDPSS
jgi:hypothetical protein